MIKVIRIQGVKSFAPDVQTTISLNPTLRVALFYGNNGAGKTAIGQVIHHNGNGINPYPGCDLECTGEGNYQYLVYNEDFVDRNFRNASAFPGIFTLGEDNAEALAEAEQLEGEEGGINARLSQIEDEARERSILEAVSLKAAQDATWKAYTDHKDGPLDSFLDGMGKSKARVFEQISSAALEKSEELATLEQLHTRMADIASSAPPKTHVNWDVCRFVVVEQSPLWQEAISGSSESRLAPLIEELRSMDWVRAGANLIRGDHCPFCQQSLPIDFTEELDRLIDTSYRHKIDQLRRMAEAYSSGIAALESEVAETFATEPLARESAELREAWASLLLLLTKNNDQIESKLRAPGEPVNLLDSRQEAARVTSQLSATNGRIDEFNDRIRHREAERSRIRQEFWKRMRFEHGGAVDVHEALVAESQRVMLAIGNEKAHLQQRRFAIRERLKKIGEDQTGTEKAVAGINARLRLHGINQFVIAKKQGEENRYCLERPNVGQELYRSLSEGEKTVIAFFYFVELVSGSLEKEKHLPQNRKIVVIDDPISSLSNTFIYDIAHLIATEIASGPSAVKQTIVLTHSLFFHHELVKQLHDLRLDKQCQYFRVVKRTHSTVVEMQRNDIKNEYDAAWEVIKDAHAGFGTTAGVANAMRCIFEHFFTFTSQRGAFKKALLEMETADRRFRPLSRYLDNQSHRNDQNITDFGDYEIQFFLDKFKEVFDATEYPHHYAIRMGLAIDSSTD